MFERYNEDARLALFHARLLVHEIGGPRLEPEHLVLGVLRACPSALTRFTNLQESQIRELLETIPTPGTRVASTHEISFSPDLRASLERAANEADDLGQIQVRPEHLLLGILVKTDGAVAHQLDDLGVSVAALRTYLRSLAPGPL